jgi:hypothetical protein
MYWPGLKNLVADKKGKKKEKHQVFKGDLKVTIYDPWCSKELELVPHLDQFLLLLMLLLFLGLPLGWKFRLLFPCLGRFCGSTICMFLCFFAAVAQSREIVIKTLIT